jgi:damage-control phosphatase, subfamily I
MRTYPDCIPCFVRQSLEAARLVSDDENLHQQILKRALQTAADWDYSQPPPGLGQGVHRAIRELSGVDDPYGETKTRFTGYLLELLPELESRVAASDDPFLAALKLAVAGNVIDFGVNMNLTHEDIDSAVEAALAWRPESQRVEALRSKLATSAKILYCGDNAGEIVFDKLFIHWINELFAPVEVTFVARGFPVLNDVTLHDSRQAGIEEVARLIDNGSDAPGCLLDDCSEQFHAALAESDLVISKGQGNYETLSELDLETYFLLKAKCQCIADDIGTQKGELVLLRKPPKA